MEDPNKWTMDKRIPVPAIIAGAFFIIGQTWYIATVMASLNYRVNTLEDYVKATQPQAAQIAVMQEKVTTIQVTLNKIEGWIATLRGGVRPTLQHGSNE